MLFFSYRYIERALNMKVDANKRTHVNRRTIEIGEQQTKQCSKEKVQNDKQRSTKHTHATNDRVTRIAAIQTVV
jgi:hypothetical protein